MRCSRVQTRPSCPLSSGRTCSPPSAPRRSYGNHRVATAGGEERARPQAPIEAAAETLAKPKPDGSHAATAISAEMVAHVDAEVKPSMAAFTQRGLHGVARIVVGIQ